MRLRSAALLLPLAVAGCTATAPLPAEAPAAREMAPTVTPTALADTELVQRYQNTITPGELAGHLYVYADDYLAGRATGEPGQRFAALWLAGQYQALGVASKGTGTARGPYDPAGYLQPFDLEGEVTARASLTASGASTVRTVFGEGADGRSYLGLGSAQTVAPSPVVFGGFGVQGDRYDDVTPLADQDLAGRWLLLLEGDPVDAAGRSVATTTGEMTRAGQNSLAKAAALLRRGNAQYNVAGILVVAAGDADVADQAVLRAGRTQSLGLAGAETGGGTVFAPMYVVSPAFADALLAPSGQTVAALRAETTANGVARRVRAG